MIKVALVGNPNVGKTSVFNYITGSQFRVGNFPGVTVEKKSSFITLAPHEFEIVDLPGIYSFIARSPDEKITREYLIEETKEAPDIIINVVDANNLSRNLYLTTYLLQLGKPIIVALTMVDVAIHSGIQVLPEKLEEQLACSVVVMDSKKKIGKEALFEALSNSVAHEQVHHIERSIFPSLINYKVESFVEVLQKNSVFTSEKSYFFAFRILEGDKEIIAKFKENQSILEIQNQVVKDLKESFVNDIFLVLVQFRYHYIEAITEKVLIKEIRHVTLTEKLDSFLLHKIWGIPLFIAIIWMVFKIAVSFGTAFQDFFNILSGGFFVDYLGHLLAPIPVLKLVIADGIGSGLQAMSTFIPITFMVFLVMTLLEDTGYLSRISVLVDRVMRFLHLPGKALAPLIMGFGCNVTSILGSRILESPAERKITIAFSPFISCGARLPVYTIVAVALFPHSQGNVIFSLYFLGLVVGMVTAFILSRFIYKNEVTSFLALELSPYQKPQLYIVLRTAFRRVLNLLKRASWLIVLFTGIFQILDHISVPKKIEKQGLKSGDISLMQFLGEKITYPLGPMGITEKNWPAGVGLLEGLLAKEGVAGAMITSYTATNPNLGKTVNEKISQKQALLNLGKTTQEALLSIPENIFGKKDENGKWQSGLLLSPGFYIPFYDIFAGNYTDDSAVKAGGGQVIPLIRKGFEDESVQDLHKRTLLSHFAAYSFLIFILLYTGCIAVMSAIKKELGVKWMLGLFFYQLFLAYGVSVIFFQIAKAFIL